MARSKDVIPYIEDDPRRVGPAFEKLTERRKQFVLFYVGRARRNAAEAYRLAGYTCANDHVANVNGCLLLHNDKVQAAIAEYCRKALVALAPIATEVAAEMLENPQTDAPTRARLIGAVWDRTGLNAQTEHKITVEHIGDDPALLAEARKMINELGLTTEQARAIFGRSVSEKVVDADFKDITEEPGGARPALAAPEGEAESEGLSPQIEELRE